MAASPHEPDQRGLALYLACAAFVHGVLWFAVALPSARAEASGRASAREFVGVDVEAAPVDTTVAAPGGGAPVEGPLPVATAQPAVRPPPKQVQAALARPSDEDESASRGALQAADDRRERDLARAAAASAAGAGPGANSGREGTGSGWDAPPIQGKIAFGNGSRGALTGRVCFLPVGTLRIADVRNCEYAATVYTDTLNIPERQFADGFPGVTSRSSWFLIDYTGTFSVTGYGTYVFRLHSDDGSYLYIDDALVIDNDGKHAPESRSGKIQLAVGEHRIKVRYAQTDDRMALQLFVRMPQSPAETVFTTHL